MPVGLIGGGYGLQATPAFFISTPYPYPVASMNPKKRMGRPPVPDAERRDVILSFRLTQVEADTFVAATDGRKEDRSELLARWVRKYNRKHGREEISGNLEKSD